MVWRFWDFICTNWENWKVPNRPPAVVWSCQRRSLWSPGHFSVVSSANAWCKIVIQIIRVLKKSSRRAFLFSIHLVKIHIIITNYLLRFWMLRRKISCNNVSPFVDSAQPKVGGLCYRMTYRCDFDNAPQILFCTRLNIICVSSEMWHTWIFDKYKTLPLFLRWYPPMLQPRSPEMRLLLPLPFLKTPVCQKENVWQDEFRIR